MRSSLGLRSQLSLENAWARSRGRGVISSKSSESCMCPDDAISEEVVWEETVVAFEDLLSDEVDTSVFLKKKNDQNEKT